MDSYNYTGTKLLDKEVCACKFMPKSVCIRLMLWVFVWEYIGIVLNSEAIWTSLYLYEKLFMEFM